MTVSHPRAVLNPQCVLFLRYGLDIASDRSVEESTVVCTLADIPRFLGRWVPTRDFVPRVIIEFAPGRDYIKAGRKVIHSYGFKARRPLGRHETAPSFNHFRDGASTMLPRRTGGLRAKATKYDPTAFRAVDVGKPGARPVGTDKQQRIAANAFRDIFMSTIRNRKAEADADDPADPESPFCNQQRKILQNKSIEELWDRIETSSSLERRTVIGDGLLRGDVFSQRVFDQLPRPTRDDLKGWVVYLSNPRRRARTPSGMKIEHGGYAGSTTRADGTWPRFYNEYEAARHYANNGVRHSQVNGGRHLEYACLPDATMHLRIVAVFDKSKISADEVILVEGLWADVLQTIADGYHTISRFIGHCAAMANSHRQACHPVGRRLSHIPLNSTSPLRQGRRGIPGSIWSWGGAVKPRTEGLIAQFKREGCAYCGKVQQKADEERPRKCKAQGYEGKVCCPACKTSWQRRPALANDPKMQQEWIEERRNDHEQKPARSSTQQLQDDGCAYCQRFQGEANMRAFTCEAPGYEDKACCASCNTGWRKNPPADANDPKVVQKWIDGKRKKSFRQQLKDDGCVICGNKTGEAAACKVPGDEGEAWCRRCSYSWLKSPELATNPELLQEWINERWNCENGAEKKTLKQRLEVEGCVVCGNKTAKGYACQVPDETDKVWCEPCRSNWALKPELANNPKLREEWRVSRVAVEAKKRK